MFGKGKEQKFRQHDQVIWLVGASSGIGEALARELANTSALVFVSARSMEKLNALSSQVLGRLVPLEVDITDRDSLAQAIKRIALHTDHLDQVIINAGICEYISSDAIDIEQVRRVMETNFFGAINVLNTCLPMIRRTRALFESKCAPKIVFVSSSVTYQALPRAGAYGASKSALRYMVESLKVDLQLEGIDVRLVSPGFVKTPLTDKNDFPMPFRISAQEAASRIIKGLDSNRFDIAFPKRFIWSLKWMSKLPDCIRFKLLGKTSRHHEYIEQQLSLSANTEIDYTIRS